MRLLVNSNRKNLIFIFLEESKIVCKLKHEYLIYSRLQVNEVQKYPSLTLTPLAPLGETPRPQWLPFYKVRELDWDFSPNTSGGLRGVKMYFI